ncbi:MAG TPA: helix-turn-helix domain-containing protein [Planctomycetes bacterium]|nr:helix-turn-helix domain-containing protein [Planctomycetota bacterium]HIL37745.1 helix-turn-helix domain-containing protein [Planctomycetota bacterium]
MGTKLPILFYIGYYRSSMIETQAILGALGRRLTTLREGRGLGVAALAEAAGLSRRYVTEAEAGRANLSLLKLASLASALGTPLGELCDLPLAAPERIALVGLRGAGKSTLGPLLARELEAPFVELDRRVEQRAGLGMGELIDLEGPDAWANWEAETLQEVLSAGQKLVLEVPGSIVERPINFERVLISCRTIWLRASPEDHWERVLNQGDRRPMSGRPKAREELANLLRTRAGAYGRCQHRLDTSQMGVEQVLERAQACLGDDSI